MDPALGDLRKVRRRRTLGDQEWFDVAYRAYLVALVGGTLIVIATDRVNDAVITAADIDAVGRDGPAVIGLVAAIAVAAGVRSGANGGPVALEPADVRHLVLSPVARSDVLRRPVLQRVRSVAAAGGLIGGIAGVLAARRLPGSTAAWLASGAAAGACSLALFASVAVLAHVVRLSRPLATALAGATVAWQIAAVATGAPGPGDAFGELALLAMAERDDVVMPAVAVGITAALVGGALRWCDRLGVESLTRRAELVSQLRFAVTMQDLRTVILLRRQLRNEQMRSAPWPLPAGGERAGAPPAIRRRGWRSLARTPLARLVRSLGFAIAAGACTVVTLRGTTPAALGIGAALFAMSLELLEPLSQEVDHPDLAGLTPVPPDAVLARLLAVPAVAIVPFALVAAAVVAIAEPDAAGAAFALAVPCAWAGACGAVLSAIGDARDQAGATASAMMVPEFAGFSTAMRTALPLLVSSLAAIPVIALREVPEAGVAVRTVLLMLLVVGASVWWVRKRNDYGARWRAFVEAGRRA